MMLLRDSIAAQCRYGDIAVRAFGGISDLIWECSQDDWQGSANILVSIYDIEREVFIHYEWHYGSCSGCDDWEGRGLIDFEIIQEMIRDCTQLNSREELERYINLLTGKEQVFEEDGVCNEYHEMADAYYKWKDGQKYNPQRFCSFLVNP